MMLAAKALTIASLGGSAMSRGLHAPRPETHTSLAQIAIKYIMIMGSPELYYLREHNIGPVPISFTKQGVLNEIEDITKIPIITTPTFTKELSIRHTPSLTADDPEAYRPGGIVPEVDVSGHFVTFVEHLLMGLVLLLLFVLYCTIIKPVQFFLSCFMDVNPVGELLDLLDLIAEYRYVTFFWLTLVLYRPMKSLMKPFVTFAASVFTRFHSNVNDGGELKNRLRRVEGKARGHSILLRALDTAQNAHAATLASESGKIVEIIEQVKRIMDVIAICQTEIGELGERMITSETRFYHLDDFVQRVGMPMVIEFLNSEVSKLTNTFNLEVKNFTYRCQSLEAEVKMLISSNNAKDEEIEVLRTAVSEMQKEKVCLEAFYRKQNFNNLNANDYYQKSLAATPAGHFISLMIAYQTALHIQVSSSMETLRRDETPVTPSPMNRSQNMPHGIPSQYPNSAPSDSPGSFTFGGSPGGISFGGPPVSFTAGGFSGGSAPSSLISHKKR